MKTILCLILLGLASQGSGLTVTLHNKLSNEVTATIKYAPQPPCQNVQITLKAGEHDTILTHWCRVTEITAIEKGATDYCIPFEHHSPWGTTVVSVDIVTNANGKCQVKRV